MSTKVSIVVVTLNRPDCVRRCLECLAEQEPAASQIVLIDASADDRTAAVVKDFPDVEYVRTDAGYGHMTKSRNLGLSRAFGDVVAFLDDDAFAHAGWLASLVEPYADPRVGGVGGRALNGQAGEEAAGVDSIGRLHADGRITGYFAADPGRPIDVDHLIGCNMSFRRTVLAELGGLRDDYPGTEVREETDVALRVRRLGYRLVFQPAAVVTHVGAAQVKGRRFDARYAYYHARNHAVLVLRNFGPHSTVAIRSVVREFGEASHEAARRVAVAAAHFAARLGGLAVGVVVGLRFFLSERGDPIRRPPFRGLTRNPEGRPPAPQELIGIESATAGHPGVNA